VGDQRVLIATRTASRRRWLDRCRPWTWVVLALPVCVACDGRGLALQETYVDFAAYRAAQSSSLSVVAEVHSADARGPCIELSGGRITFSVNGAARDADLSYPAEYDPSVGGSCPFGPVYGADLPDLDQERVDISISFGDVFEECAALEDSLCLEPMFQFAPVTEPLARSEPIVLPLVLEYPVRPLGGTEVASVTTGDCLSREVIDVWTISDDGRAAVLKPGALDSRLADPSAPCRLSVDLTVRRTAQTRSLGWFATLAYSSAIELDTAP